VTERGKHARPVPLEQIREYARERLRQLDRIRLMCIDAAFTPIGQVALRMAIASGVLLLALMASLIVIWFT
jgi:hypothetical protein